MKSSERYLASHFDSRNVLIQQQEGGWIAESWTEMVWKSGMRQLSPCSHAGPGMELPTHGGKGILQKTLSKRRDYKNSKKKGH